MEITSKKQALIVESLELLMKQKEQEIEQIRKKTEDDYQLEKEMMGKFSSTTFSLELVQERDIQKIRLITSQISELEKMINGGEHRILAVPRFIRLNLTAE